MHYRNCLAVVPNCIAKCDAIPDKLFPDIYDETNNRPTLIYIVTNNIFFIEQNRTIILYMTKLIMAYSQYTN